MVEKDTLEEKCLLTKTGSLPVFYIKNSGEKCWNINRINRISNQNMETNVLTHKVLKKI